MLHPKPFTKSDWEAYSGCEQKVPYIATVEICDLQIDFIFDTCVELYLYDMEKTDLVDCFTLEDNGVHVINCFTKKMNWNTFVETLLTKVTVRSALYRTKINLTALEAKFKRMANWSMR